MYTVDMLLEDSIGRSCATGGSPTGLLKTPTNTVGRMRTQPAHTLGTRDTELDFEGLAGEIGQGEPDAHNLGAV